MSSLCESSSKKVFILLASIVLALSLSSRYSPYLPVPINEFLRSSILPFPGITNLKLLECPRVILSKWCKGVLELIKDPFIKTLESGLGSMKIFPF